MGCIPDPVNKVVESFSGTKEDEGITMWPFDWKNVRYFFRSSCEEIEGIEFLNDKSE